MEQIQQFRYEEFWKNYERKDTPGLPTVETDGWTSALDMEDPAPPWVRVVSRRDPFPPCKALVPWPSNYPVGDLADLNDQERSETKVDQFVYSDAELEGWSKSVGCVSDPSDGPSWLPKKGVNCAPRKAFIEDQLVNPRSTGWNSHNRKRRASIGWF